MTTPRGREDGETLIEVTIAILILAIVFVAIMSTFATSITVSTIHKYQATEQTIARDFAEYLQYGASFDTSCPASYASAVSSFSTTYQLPDGTQPLATGDYSLQITNVSYVAYTTTGLTTEQATFGGTCSAQVGAQRIDFAVSTSKDSRATMALQVVKRR